MSNGKALKLNTISPVVNKIIALVCSFFLPRLFIRYYGSDVNGLITSITNFLSVITLMDMGLGAVVQSALYSPIYNKNEDEISGIVKSSRRFFNKITGFYFIYVVFLMFVFPFVKGSYDFSLLVPLIAVISVESISQNYLGITNTLLLNADKKNYVSVICSSICALINFALCFVLIKLHYSVIIVKSVSMIVFIIKPVFLKLYVEKNYNINKKIKPTNEPLKQKWNGVAQHLAFYVTTNTDVIVLTVFSTFENISVYNVYNMVAGGLAGIVILAQSGVAPVLGEMIVSENSELNEKFGIYEWFSHSISTFVFSCAFVLIVPFVKYYTSGITDADYIQPVFAFILVSAQYFYSLRNPYNVITIAAGQFKETQTSSIIEMCINLVLTLLFVKKFGLTGVAIGTAVALLYRMIYLIFYMPKIVEDFNVKKSFKYLLCDLIIIVISVLLNRIFIFNDISLFGWLIFAVKTSVITVFISFIFNFILCRAEINKFIKMIKKE